jgi:hypothetical protein
MTRSETSVREGYDSVEPIVASLREGKLITGYDIDQVVAAVMEGRENLVEGLRAPELAALRDYVVQAYPVPSPATLERVEDVRTGLLIITEGSKNFAFSNVIQFIERIRALIRERPLSIDLTVSSLPDGATFDLWATAGPHRTTTTNNVVENVYRGFYHYKITRGGFKLIEEPLNLVDSDGRRLDCFLNDASEQDGPHPCKLR